MHISNAMHLDIPVTRKRSHYTEYHVQIEEKSALNGECKWLGLMLWVLPAVVGLLSYYTIRFVYEIYKCMEHVN